MSITPENETKKYWGGCFENGKWKGVFLNKIPYWTQGQMYIKPEADKDSLKWCR